MNRSRDVWFLRARGRRSGPVLLAEVKSRAAIDTYTEAVRESVTAASDDGATVVVFVMVTWTVDFAREVVVSGQR